MASTELTELSKSLVPQTGAITSDVLKEQADAQFAPMKDATGASGMLGLLEEQSNQFIQETEQNRTDAQKALKTSVGDYLSAKLNTEGLAEQTTNRYAKRGGVDDIEKELGTINQQIRAEQHSLRREVERLDENKLGGTRAQIAGQQDFVERQSLKKQADLYVIQQGIQGRFDSAKAIADRQIQVQLERDKNYIEALKENFELNKELFTEADARAFNLKVANQERAFKKQEAEMKSISDLSLDALQNGAPPEIASQMRQAGSLDEAMEIGGQYVGLLDRQLARMQMQKLEKEISLLGEPSDADKKKLEDAKTNRDTAIAVAQDKIQTIDMLYKKNPDGSTYQHPGMKGSVGAYGLARWTPFDIDRGDRAEFVATVEQLRSQEFVDAILSMKQQGGTLGALNEEEGRQMRNAATKIEQWSLKEEGGKVYGYEASEKDFAEELERIRSLAQRALMKAGGDLISEEEDATLDEIMNMGVNTSTFNGASYY